MARVLAVAPDLMFASRIEATLGAAGHEVKLATSLSEADPEVAELIVADLDAESAEALAALKQPVLGYYSHVEAETGRKAEAAGIDLVVPRSRMAREMPALVSRLLR